MERKDVQFADKIKSLFIDGDCAVVLFENFVDDINECAKCIADSATNEPKPSVEDACKKCWDGSGPGSHSEVFTQSVNDLTSHNISGCGGRERFGFGEKKSCASAIAIFPIKK